MLQEANELSSEAFAVRLVMLERKLKRVRQLVDRTDVLVDELTCDFEALRVGVGRPVAAPLGRTRAPRPVDVIPRPPRPARECSVVLVTHPDGSGVAQIDGVGTPLPPYLAALLSILMADEGVAPDRLVGWTSVVDIQAGLKKRTRQNRSKAAVKELVYRLRKLLDQHLEDPFLLQHKRRLGYRFAVRRGVGTKPEGDNL